MKPYRANPSLFESMKSRHKWVEIPLNSAHLRGNCIYIENGHEMRAVVVALFMCAYVCRSKKGVAEEIACHPSKRR